MMVRTLANQQALNLKESSLRLIYCLQM
ncbi:hypothetical protein PO124_25915 [Bacillus licheniformis]|nr:hypothetical protein [Bacillus licheniformis]